MSCWKCLCQFCARNVELSPAHFTPGEVDEPCFNCDECRYYDGDWRKEYRKCRECEKYVEAQKYTERRAAALRRSFRVIQGGNHVQ